MRLWIAYHPATFTPYLYAAYSKSEARAQAKAEWGHRDRLPAGVILEPLRPRA